MINKRVELLAVVAGECRVVATTLWLDVDDTEEVDEELYQDTKEDFEDEHPSVQIVGRVITTYDTDQSQEED